MVLIPGLEKSPGEGNGTPLQYSCLGNPMDKRSLAGYCPWGHKESDTTKHMHSLLQVLHKCLSSSSSPFSLSLFLSMLSPHTLSLCILSSIHIHCVLLHARLRIKLFAIFQRTTECVLETETKWTHG